MPGSPVYLSRSDNPKRKLKYTLEIIDVNGVLVGIHTGHPNKLVEEAILNGVISELQGYTEIRREIKYGQNSRVDLLLQGDGLKDCFVEVKNVTLAENGVALFPDAVTVRGQKHLNELMEMVQKGFRAAMVFVIQRSDVNSFSPAYSIDPEYGRLLKLALENSVEVVAYQAKVTLEEILLSNPLPVFLNGTP
ncbi:MAG: DNA/RNA nuclease SfsA [Calditrichia bacterium]